MRAAKVENLIEGNTYVTIVPPVSCTQGAQERRSKCGRQEGSYREDSC